MSSSGNWPKVAAAAGAVCLAGALHCSTLQPSELPHAHAATCPRNIARMLTPQPARAAYLLNRPINKSEGALKQDPTSVQKMSIKRRHSTGDRAQWLTSLAHGSRVALLACKRHYSLRRWACVRRRVGFSPGEARGGCPEDGQEGCRRTGRPSARLGGAPHQLPLGAAPARHASLPHRPNPSGPIPIASRPSPPHSGNAWAGDQPPQVLFLRPYVPTSIVLYS